MPVLDWIFLGVLLVSLTLGAWRGLVYELLSVMGWVLAFILAQWLGLRVGQALPMGRPSETIQFVVGFVLVFILTVFAVGMVAWVIKRLVESVGLRPVDRLLGGLFGLLRGAILSLVFSMLVLMSSLRNSGWWQESLGASIAELALHALQPILPVSLGGRLP
ncbi:MAG: CvpA family protein [Hylemonella sp.]|nr:CvpA family protein [Hylemonella sp.]